MALEPGSHNFAEGGVIAIDLDAGGAVITTDLIGAQLQLGFAIEAKTASTVEGATKLTWTLKSTNLNDVAELKDYDEFFAKDKLAGEGVYSTDPNIFKSFAIEITKNDASGTIEFIFTQ